jgi:hypothetical protein
MIDYWIVIACTSLALGRIAFERRPQVIMVLMASVLLGVSVAYRLLVEACYD